jgi:hypothetical protein
MAYVTHGQAPFVSRTGSRETTSRGSYTEVYFVDASTTFHCTGSEAKYSAVQLVSGSAYTITLRDGGNVTEGLTAGVVYEYVPSKVVTVASTGVNLLK